MRNVPQHTEYGNSELSFGATYQLTCLETGNKKSGLNDTDLCQMNLPNRKIISILLSKQYVIIDIENG